MNPYDPSKEEIENFQKLSAHEKIKLIDDYLKFLFQFTPKENLEKIMEIRKKGEFPPNPTLK